MCGGKLEKEEKDELADIYDQIVEIYVEYRCELLDALQKCAPTSKTPESHTPKPQESAGGQDLRLPTVNIPCFPGSYTKWRAFHDVLVSLVDDNDSLSNVQKLHHLKSSLSGEAERLIQHFGLEEDNYVKAWDLLKGR